MATDQVCPLCHGKGVLGRTCGSCRWYVCVLDEDTYYRTCNAPLPIAVYSRGNVTTPDRDASECPCWALGEPPGASDKG
jgi:hypothetical protein